MRRDYAMRIPPFVCVLTLALATPIQAIERWLPPAATVPAGWHPLAIETTPAGAGTVDTWPYGGAFLPGTAVRVRARAHDGYAFSHWEGVAAGSPRADAEPFGMDGPHTVRAVFAAIAAPGARIAVGTVSELAAAIATAQPGTVIECGDGTYTLGAALTISRQATPTLPIVIRARNRGGATITGSAGIVLNGAHHVVIEGFTFLCTMKTAVELKDTVHCRITRNTFLQGASSASQWWVTLSGTTGRHNRIDHNRFAGKRTMGNYLSTTTRENVDRALSQFDVIDRNAFIDIGPNEGNGKEAIRLGNSWISMYPGYYLVESNYFERCDGDAETVSNKSCDNIFRWNTFINCWGSLCLRHGNRCVADGNAFIRPDEIIDWNKVDASLAPELRRIGGLRAYGDDHAIINNYFYQTNAGTTGLGTLVLCSGRVNWTEANYPSGDLNSTNAADRIFVAYNTFVDAPRSSIDIGYSSGGNAYPANEMVFYNNLVVARQGRNPGKLIYLPGSVPPPTGTVWRGNIAHAAGGVQLGDWPQPFADTELRLADPSLAKIGDRWTIDAASAAAAAATRATVPHQVCVPWDFEGQPRTGDHTAVGNDHLSSDPVRNRILRAADVGPDAPATVLRESYAAWIIRHELAPAHADPLADPAGDKVTNLLAYALGLNPLADKRPLLPTVLLVAADGTPQAAGAARYLALDVTLDARAQGIRCTIETSADLQLWQHDGTAVHQLAESATRLFYRDAVALGDAAAGRRFIRLTIAQEGAPEPAGMPLPGAAK
jgi:hypothetical protein